MIKLHANNSAGASHEFPNDRPAEPREVGEMTIKTVFYSAIRPAEGQTIEQVILRAQKIGYSMVLFNGYSDHDLGWSALEPTSSPCQLVGGAKRSEAKKNRGYLLEITDYCQVSIGGAADWPHLLQTSGTLPRLKH